MGRSCRVHGAGSRSRSALGASSGRARLPPKRLQPQRKPLATRLGPQLGKPAPTPGTQASPGLAAPRAAASGWLARGRGSAGGWGYAPRPSPLPRAATQLPTGLGSSNPASERPRILSISTNLTLGKACFLWDEMVEYQQFL